MCWATSSGPVHTDGKLAGRLASKFECWRRLQRTCVLQVHWMKQYVALMNRLPPQASCA